MSRVTVEAPKVCPSGHRLVPPNVQVFFGPVPGEERRAIGWRCWTCGQVTWQE